MIKNAKLKLDSTAKASDGKTKDTSLIPKTIANPMPVLILKEDYEGIKAEKKEPFVKCFLHLCTALSQVDNCEQNQSQKVSHQEVINLFQEHIDLIQLKNNLGYGYFIPNRLAQSSKKIENKAILQNFSRQLLAPHPNDQGKTYLEQICTHSNPLAPTNKTNTAQLLEKLSNDPNLCLLVRARKITQIGYFGSSSEILTLLNDAGNPSAFFSKTESSETLGIKAISLIMPNTLNSGSRSSTKPPTIWIKDLEKAKNVSLTSNEMTPRMYIISTSMIVANPEAYRQLVDNAIENFKPLIILTNSKKEDGQNLTDLNLLASLKKFLPIIDLAAEKHAEVLYKTLTNPYSFYDNKSPDIFKQISEGIQAAAKKQMEKVNPPIDYEKNRLGIAASLNKAVNFPSPDKIKIYNSKDTTASEKDLKASEFPLPDLQLYGPDDLAL